MICALGLKKAPDSPVFFNAKADDIYGIN